MPSCQYSSVLLETQDVGQTHDTHTMLRRFCKLGSKLAGSKEAQDYAAGLRSVKPASFIRYLADLFETAL